MKNIIEIESAEELVRLARVRSLSLVTADAPYIDPAHVDLVIDGGVPRLQDKQGRFQLSSDITESDIYEAMAKKCNIALYLT